MKVLGRAPVPSWAGVMSHPGTSAHSPVAPPFCSADQEQGQGARFAVVGVSRRTGKGGEGQQSSWALPPSPAQRLGVGQELLGPRNTWKCTSDSGEGHLPSGEPKT